MVVSALASQLPDIGCQANDPPLATLMRSREPNAEFSDMAGKALTIEWLVDNAPALFDAAPNASEKFCKAHFSDLNTIGPSNLGLLI